LKRNYLIDALVIVIVKNASDHVAFRKQFLSVYTYEKCKLHRILVGKAGRSRTLERPEHKWKDNSKMGLKNKVRRCALKSSSSGYGPLGALVNTVMNLWVY
jgi:hypothetical protein